MTLGILSVLLHVTYTGHTQKNGAVLIVNTIKTAPFFFVFPVFKNSLPKG
jgi:hypothetical protein